MESQHQPPGRLYLGTTSREAANLVAGGRPSARHARQIGARLYATESIAVAYAHGPYDLDPSRGPHCVVELRVNPTVRWLDLGSATSIDGLFCHEPLDAVRTWGDLWAIWNTSALVQEARILSHDEALRRLIREFEHRGRDALYEGITDEYATLWWQRARSASPSSPRARALSARLRAAAGFASRAQAPEPVVQHPAPVVGAIA